MGKVFIYLGDNKSFFGKKYIKDGARFFDENHGKLQPLEDGEVSNAYFNHKYEEVNEVEPIIANEALSYGTRAYDIYEEMCRRFGWYLFERNNFLPQNSLYSEKATQEGYAVHFICHNNWTQTDTGDWLNTIYDDRIEESWPTDKFYKPKYHHLIGEKRVVFAHNTKGYAFIGVYETVGWEQRFDFKSCKNRIIKIYKLISKTYPFL